MAEYGPRVVDAEIRELLRGTRALSIEGARGVGKTTTVSQHARTVFRLDDEHSLALLRADPQRVLRAEPPVAIDEWQLFPEVWGIVRREVDANPQPGRFILSGSATPPTQPTHTGAGRMITVQMRPLALAERWDTPQFAAPAVSLAALLGGGRPSIEGTTEVGLDDYVREIVSGGLPGLRAEPPRVLRASLRSYLQRALDVDFAEAGGTTRNPVLLRRWLDSYAAATGTTASIEAIRKASTAQSSHVPSRPVSAKYQDALARIGLLDPFGAWTPTHNRLARLARRPKHSLADPALSASLLNLSTDALLRSEGPASEIRRPGPFVGALFESLVGQSLRIYAQASEASVMHLRDSDGRHEIDFIVEGHDGSVVAVEVKLSAHVRDRHAAGLRWLAERIGDRLTDALIVTTGPVAYRRADGIAVVPAALLGP